MTVFTVTCPLMSQICPDRRLVKTKLRVQLPPHSTLIFRKVFPSLSLRIAPLFIVVLNELLKTPTGRSIPTLSADILRTIVALLPDRRRSPKDTPVRRLAHYMCQLESR